MIFLTINGFSLKGVLQRTQNRTRFPSDLEQLNPQLLKNCEKSSYLRGLASGLIYHSDSHTPLYDVSARGSGFSSSKHVFAPGIGSISPELTDTLCMRLHETEEKLKSLVPHIGVGEPIIDVMRGNLPDATGVLTAEIYLDLRPVWAQYDEAQSAYHNDISGLSCIWGKRVGLCIERECKGYGNRNKKPQLTERPTSITSPL